ncbi:redoxin domain-containing protein [Cesiribacter andamanensis]|uniref:AhpC/TSA family protein n=1 Tax=Cesiribacter andamanensis AMV16 TaxID=1279009 RepID=M7N8G4_9BACT|nr:redoxin domain-containing protein [Cesiribacter andamanensis]EMR03506.1 AhpC/TSA family protein [Cesiribacter andamanensis AMV16]
MLKPNQPVPPIEVPLLQGGHWSLHRQTPKEFSLLVFYRGHHCPICRHYLHTLSTLLPEFSQRGIEVIALSVNSRQKALQSQNEWFTGALPLGYDFPIEQARQLGLYISRGLKPHEPELFFEPAILTVRPDNRLYSIIVQSTPFGRPHIKDLLQTFDYFIDENYPPRGDA